MKSVVRILAARISAAAFLASLICGLISSAAWSSSARGDEAAVAKSQSREIGGIDFGGKTPLVVVARDQAAWDDVVQATGERRMLPIGFAQGQDPASLDRDSGR